MQNDLYEILIVWRFVRCLEFPDVYEGLQFKTFARCSDQKEAKVCPTTLCDSDIIKVLYEKPANLASNAHLLMKNH